MSDGLNVRIHYFGYKEQDDELMPIGSDRYQRMAEIEQLKVRVKFKRHILSVEKLEQDSERLDQPWKELLEETETEEEKEQGPREIASDEDVNVDDDDDDDVEIVPTLRDFDDDVDDDDGMLRTADCRG